jgi:hypothetical protein
MTKPGTLLYCEEALQFIERIPDPIVRNFVNMAFVHFVKAVQLEKRSTPRTDVDMLFLVTSLSDYFAERAVLERTLAGEKVGAWFEEDTTS